MLSYYFAADHERKRRISKARFKRKSKKYGKEGWKTVGLVGISACSGVTHLSIMLANYLSGVRRFHVAVLEWNSHRDLEKMERVCTGKNSDAKPFLVQDVSYYKNAGARELLSCMDQDFDKIIIDFGSSYESSEVEFLRCEKKFILLSLSEWQVKTCLEFAVKERTKLKISWEYAAIFGSEETRIEMKKKLGIPVWRIPFSVDAFTVMPDHITFFNHFI